MKIFAGTSNRELAEKVAEGLGTELAAVEIVRFADEECRVRIEEEVNGEELVFIQSTFTPADRYYIETFFFLDAARRVGADKVTLIMPYMGYARQDKEHRPGEAVSASVIVECMESAGLDKFVTFDIHSKHIFSMFKDTQTVHKSCLPMITKEIIEKEELDKESVGIFSPDQDGAYRARDVIQELGYGNYGFVQKERDLDELHTLKAVHGQRFMGEPDGKDIILVDDIITSGGTMVQAAEILKEEGAGRIYAAATHSAFANSTGGKLQDSLLDTVSVTDSILLQEKQQFSKLHITSIAEAIANLLT